MAIIGGRKKNAGTVNYCPQSTGALPVHLSTNKELKYFAINLHLIHGLKLAVGAHFCRIIGTSRLPWSAWVPWPGVLRLLVLVDRPLGLLGFLGLGFLACWSLSVAPWFARVSGFWVPRLLALCAQKLL